jgi:hypothetical protein
MLGLWSVRSLYRAGFLMTVWRELARHKLDLVGVQEARREDGVTEPAGEYTFFYGKGSENMSWLFSPGFLPRDLGFSLR